jgi:hypothetical protein
MKIHNDSIHNFDVYVEVKNIERITFEKVKNIDTKKNR